MHKGVYGTARKDDGPSAGTGGHRAHNGRPEPGAGADQDGPFREPAAVLVEPCVGQHEERAHDDDHRDLPRLSRRDELTILRAQVRVVTGRRQSQAYGAAAAPAPGRPG